MESSWAAFGAIGGSIITFIGIQLRERRNDKTLRRASDKEQLEALRIRYKSFLSAIDRAVDAAEQCRNVIIKFNKQANRYYFCSRYQEALRLHRSMLMDIKHGILLTESNTTGRKTLDTAFEQVLQLVSDPVADTPVWDKRAECLKKTIDNIELFVSSRSSESVL